MRHFYQINKDGSPIQGSNVNIKNKPRTFGSGQRWVEYVSAGESQPCCEDGPLIITSLGKKWRYYVRLRNQNVVGSVLTPIPGTLEKHMHKPTNYTWQEVIGRYQCSTVPQFNATYTTSDGSINGNLYTLLGLSSDYYTFVAFSGTTDEGLMTVELDTDGTLVVTPDGAPSTDTVTLQYSNGSCLFAFQMTFVFE